MHGVDIMSCSGFGIKMESSEIDCETPIIGELSLLEENQNCKTNFSSVFFSDNKKGNVILKKWDEDFLDSKFSENNNSTEMICASDSSESESDSDDLKISSDEGL